MNLNATMVLKTLLVQLLNFGESGILGSTLVITLDIYHKMKSTHFTLIFTPYRIGTIKTHVYGTGGGFIEPDKKRLEPIYKDNPGWKLLGGKSLRTKNIRSATPRGFARAVFEANKL